MAKPTFVAVKFPNPGVTDNALHTKMGDTADTAKFTGCSGVSKFDSVKVVGERGTIWMGTIASATSTTAVCKDLEVKQEIRRKRQKNGA